MRWEKKNIRPNQLKTGIKDANKIEMELKILPHENKTSQNRSSNITIFDLLHQWGCISLELLNQAQKEGEKEGKFIGEVLEEKGIMSHERIITLLIKQCKLPLVSLLHYTINPISLEMMPLEICEKFMILPIDVLGNNLTLAMVNPLDLQAIEIAKNYCNGYQISPILCSYKEYKQILKKLNQKLKEPTSTFFYTQTRQQNTTPNIELTNTSHNLINRELSRNTSYNDIDESFPNTIFSKPVAKEILESTPPTENKEDLTIQNIAISLLDNMKGTFELLIRKIKFFNGLIPKEIAHIFQFTIQKNYSKNEFVFREGDITNSIYILVSGKIGILNNNNYLYELFPGETFGEISVFTQAKQTTDAKALEDSTLLELNLKQIYRFNMPITTIKMLTNIILILNERLDRISSTCKSF